MDHVTRIGVFIAVVKNAGFAGAARELGITSSAVSKQIQNLEYDMQVKLLNRTTRRVSVTEEGAIFFERAARALDDLREAEEQIQELKSRPRGALRVSLPLGFGSRYLVKDIGDFARLYPEVEMDVSFDDRKVDLMAEGYDVLIRIGALQDSTLIARRLASCPMILCASPEYLKTHGVPLSPSDLSAHKMLAYTNNNSSTEWRYKSPDGPQGSVILRGTLKTNSGEMICEAAVQGIGIAVLPIFYVAEYLAEGKLCHIFPEYKTWPDRDIYAVFMPNRYLSQRMRLFIDHLTASCKMLPWERSVL